MRYLIILLMLAACSQPTVIEKPVIVKVPIAVSCTIKPPTEPKWKEPLNIHSSTFDQVRASEEDIGQAHAYIKQLQAALKACEK